MRKADSVLLYFLKRRSLSRTEIMKYLYYYEYIHYKHTKRKGTELVFVRWDYGPFEATVYDSLQEYVDSGFLVTNEYINGYGRWACRYTGTCDVDHNLDETEKEVADYVLHEFSTKSFQEMLDLVYSTPPMLKVLEAEEENEGKLLGEVLPMTQTNGTFKRTKAGERGCNQAPCRQRQAPRLRSRVHGSYN
ncbi:SocA family protein [Paenibacillus thiaminolyticus]|uniref:Panacea domain-containing protein n=1 Tax=Paenibacillus thiaminolyticus TaxID=49283 RepID=UPI001161DFFD|nr:Panacea domain-containing protein [Paenibacillus thiaminolyticus]NGP58780.1 SocA family protein [Paenibacillus thiaminolyticus]